MAYCLHVTRDQIKPKPSNISLEEWESVVDSFTNMELVSSFKKKSASGSEIELNGEGMAIFQSGPRKVYFTFFNGVISTAETDNAVQNHLHYLAHFLNAEVRGDEGELYETPAHIQKKFHSPQSSASNKQESISSKADRIAFKINSLMSSWPFRIIFWGGALLIITAKVFWFDS